ncbi:MAG TPA: NUDIX hydrolase [Jatrophihabitantaceae bacterium]|nr:NUDIX hydrolase [Jatrophihabitantaceae bacterium]
MSEPDPTPVRDAATVVLLRDGSDGLEAWLLTRVSEMVFAAGMTVFPGGRVDDADASLPFATDACAAIAARFDCDETLARALVGAAVRETFEETGVLLTVPAASLAQARADVEAGVTSFGALLREHDLAVDVDSVHPWGRWVTPPNEVRRYDTRFFVAALPSDAEALDVTSESSVASWVRVQDAIDQARRGERPMLPPTMFTLTSLAPYAKVADVLAAADARVLDAVHPSLRFVGDDIIAELPDGTSVRLPRPPRR